MSIVYNQKKASDLVVGGRHMREAWINGQKIWPENTTGDILEELSALSWREIGPGEIAKNYDNQLVWYTSTFFRRLDKATGEWEEVPGMGSGIYKHITNNYMGFIVATGIRGSAAFVRFGNSVWCEFYISYDDARQFSHETITADGLENGFDYDQYKWSDLLIDYWVFDGADLYLSLFGNKTKGTTVYGGGILVIVPNFASGNRKGKAVFDESLYYLFSWQGNTYADNGDLVRIGRDLSITPVWVNDEYDIYDVNYAKDQIFLGTRSDQGDYLFTLDKDLHPTRLMAFEIDGYRSQLMAYNERYNNYVFCDRSRYYVSDDLLNWRYISKPSKSFYKFFYAKGVGYFATFRNKGYDSENETYYSVYFAPAK